MTTIEDFRRGFTEEPGYLNYASVGPISEAVRDELRAEYDVLSRMRFGAAERVRAQEQRLKDAVSALTGHDAEGILPVPNTSTGLMSVMFGLDGHVVISRDEFPSMTTAAVRAQEARDRLSITWVDGASGHMSAEVVAQAISDDVTAVAVPLVDARTGYRTDLTAIREVIGDRLLIVDAIQGAGVVSADYTAADVVVSGGQKWLRAGWGTGFLSFSSRALERITPVISGHTGTGDAEPWGHVPDPATGTAEAFSVTRADPVACARLAASLDEVESVGIEAIQDAALDRTDEVIELLDEAELHLVSPRRREERSGIVVVRPDEGRLAGLGAALHNTGVTTTTRQDTVRFSIHAGTDDATVRMLKQALLVFRSSTD